MWQAPGVLVAFKLVKAPWPSSDVSCVLWERGTRAGGIPGHWNTFWR
jgi:hypothetical protein